jgi:hypothetical protein
VYEYWFIYCFTSRSIIFHLYGDVTIASEGLHNLGLCSAPRAFEQGGIFIVPHLLWHGASVFPVSSEGPPLTTRMGMRRTYSNPDPHGKCMNMRTMLRVMLQTHFIVFFNFLFYDQTHWKTTLYFRFFIQDVSFIQKTFGKIKNIIATYRSYFKIWGNRQPETNTFFSFGLMSSCNSFVNKS